jgi:hypothetical protein
MAYKYQYDSRPIGKELYSLKGRDTNISVAQDNQGCVIITCSSLFQECKIKLTESSVVEDIIEALQESLVNMEG